jgi:hypothetical protein
LYRAAELTLDHGYDYFTVADRHLDRSTAYSGGTEATARRGAERAGLSWQAEHCWMGDIDGPAPARFAPTGAPAGLGVVAALRSPQRARCRKGARRCPACPTPNAWS